MADPNKLEDAIRSIVRDELGAVRDSAVPVAWKDLIWASLAFIDFFLLFLLVSEDTLNNAKVKFFYEKLLPWLSTTVFISLFTVFKERSKSFLQLRSFKVFVGSSLIVLTVFVFPWFAMNPIYGSPNDVVVKMDATAVDTNRPLNYSLLHHDVTVEPRINSSEVHLAKYSIPFGAGLSSSWDRKPHWPPLRITILDPGINRETVTFTISGPLTNDFLDAPDEVIFPSCENCQRDKDAGPNFRVIVRNKQRAQIWFPIGKYGVVIEKTDCPNEFQSDVVIDNDNAIIETKTCK